MNIGRQGINIRLQFQKIIVNGIHLIFHYDMSILGAEVNIVETTHTAIGGQQMFNSSSVS